MTFKSDDPSRAKAEALLAAHEAAIEKLQHDLLALLPDDPTAAARKVDIEKAFEKYLHCWHELAKHVVPNP